MSSTPAGAPSDNHAMDPAAGSIADPNFNDNDSALGSEVTDSDWTSLASSTIQYPEENGRRYHAYRAGRYDFPNDERENERLDLEHSILLQVLDDKLHLASLSDDIAHVLDIGTGTGIWAIEFADQHPACEITGTDLSPIQPNWVPRNVRFVIGDAEEQWAFSQKFDYVHVRVMIVSIRDWARFVGQGFENLKPGGYMEVSDFIPPMVAVDDTFGPHNPLWKWNANHVVAARNKGQPFVTSEQVARWMTRAGFEDVVVKDYLIPTNPWPKDRKMKKLGTYMMMNMLEGIEAFTLRLWTQQLGWTREQIQLFLADVTKDIKNRNIHSASPFFVVYGRKPQHV